MLTLYENPERLAEEVPSIRLLSRTQDDIRMQAQSVANALRPMLAGRVDIDVDDCKSQIGSGALPVDSLPSAALALVPVLSGRKSVGGALKRLAADLRRLAIPVVGRIEDDRLLLDLRCLDDEAAFIDQFNEFAG